MWKAYEFKREEKEPDIYSIRNIYEYCGAFRISCFEIRVYSDADKELSVYIPR